ncbi:MAG: recombinase family protein, partial [Clostridia bacterium]|nr:recombinase family protein [Clostridia bacterium]
MKEKSKNIKFAFPVYDKISDDLSGITAIYLRVSTDSQAQEGYGLDVQYNAIERYVKAYDIENPVVFIDDGYTGVNEDRPAFKKMRLLMSAGKIKLVIAYSLDRVGRTQMLILRFLKEDCALAGCDFLAVKENVDSRNKQTYMILISILSMFAELDHDAIVAKLTLGREQRASEGHWKGGGNPPFGYKYSKEADNLVVDEEQAKKVRQIFEMYVKGGYSPRQIADLLGLSGDTAVFNV